jgi:hypothetical protein
MSFRQDLTYAARLLRRSPLFTLTAVLSLAIGIAGNAAIFSLADAPLLRERPGIADPERLVDVGRSQRGQGFDNFSYSVTQRTREIGVRVALGVARRDVLRLIVGQAMMLAGAGALLGVVLAAALTRLLAGLLYGIRPIDPVSFGVGAALFGTLALVASWLPARRAARVNPVEALRSE